MAQKTHWHLLSFITFLLFFQLLIAGEQKQSGMISLYFPYTFNDEDYISCNRLETLFEECLGASIEVNVEDRSIHFICDDEEMERLSHSVCEILTAKESRFESIRLWLEGADALTTQTFPVFLARGIEDETYHFHTLRLTESDCHHISKLIKHLADLGLWELLKKTKDMKKLGHKIEPVHPMRFLGYIFSHPELKPRMPRIRENHFKWKNFMDGLCNRLEREFQNGQIIRFIPGFAQAVQRPSHEVERFIHQRDWYGLMDYLMSK